MSFRCAKCDAVSRRGELVVTETREKTYFESRTERGFVYQVETGTGYETVHEERWCLECAAEKRRLEDESLSQVA